MKTYTISAPVKTKSSVLVALPQVIAVMVKNVLLAAFGMTLGYPTILIPGLSGSDPNETFRLDEDEISWIGSINLMCVPIGCVLSGILTQPVGRRRSMQVVALPLAASWIIFRFSNQVWHIYLALAITGLCGGLVEAPVLAYVAEITTPSIRGMLSATSTLSIVLGILLQFLVGTLLPWRTVALVSLTLPILALCLLSLMPESPHWLIMHNRLNQAHKSLAWLRGWTTLEDVAEEFRLMCQSHQKITYKQGFDNPAFKASINNVNGSSLITTEAKSFTKSKLEHLRQLTQKNFLWPFSMVSFIFFLTNFTGAWSLQTYAVKVFASLNAPMNRYYATILLGLAEFLGCFISIFMVRCMGKRVMGFMSLCAVGLCDVIVGVYSYKNALHYIQFNEKDVPAVPTINEHNWIPLIFLILIAFTGHCGLKGLPWILIGEIFPHETRAAGCGIASAVSYICGFLANKVFLNMISTLTISGTYWFYGGMAFVGCVITYFILPETEGKPLQEITDHFAGISKLDNKVRRKSAGKDNAVV